MGWTPVVQAWPEEKQVVLVWGRWASSIGAPGFWVATYDEGHFYTADEAQELLQVSDWMPLPTLNDERWELLDAKPPQFAIALLVGLEARGILFQRPVIDLVRFRSDGQAVVSWGGEDLGVVATHWMFRPEPPMLKASELPGKAVQKLL